MRDLHLSSKLVIWICLCNLAERMPTQMFFKICLNQRFLSLWLRLKVSSSHPMEFLVFSVYIRSRAAPPPSSLKALNRPKCVKYRVQITAVLMTGYENERWQQLLLMILPNCHCCLDNPPCFFPTLNHQRRRGRTAEPWLMLLLFIGNLDRVHFRVNMEAEKNTLKC